MNCKQKDRLACVTVLPLHHERGIKSTSETQSYTPTIVLDCNFCDNAIVLISISAVFKTLHYIAILRFSYRGFTALRMLFPSNCLCYLINSEQLYKGWAINSTNKGL